MATSGAMGYLPNVHHPDVMRSIWRASPDRRGDKLGATTRWRNRTVRASLHESISVEFWAMAEVTRAQVEERAYRIWLEAGAPEGSSLAHWLQAEVELGVIPRAETDDPMVTLQELAVEAQSTEQSGPAEAKDRLQASVGTAVPQEERLPCRAEENPLSEHVAEIAEAGAPARGRSTLEGGDRVPQ